MSSLLNADLPSEDEEDQDFVPEAETASTRAGKRVVTSAQPFTAPQQSAAKRAKVEAAWDLLNKPVRRSANKGHQLQQEHQQQSQKPAQSQQATPAEKASQTQQGGIQAASAVSRTGASSGPQQQASRALLAAKAARAGLLGQKGSATVTRQFAGKNVEICTEAVAKPAEASAAAKAAKQKSSLDAVLSSLQATKKANVLDKSRGDWTAFKKSDKTADEELAAHTNSNKKYLDKIDFLKQAELNEYERERAARLKGDIRLRGQS